MEYKLEGCNLRLLATPAEMKRLERWKMKKRIGQPWVQFEVFNHFTGFEWVWLNTDITGDMTAGPAIAAIGPPEQMLIEPTLASMQKHQVVYAGFKRNRSGMKHYYHRIIRRWIYMDYCLRNPEDELVNQGQCIFQGIEDSSVVFHTFQPTEIKKIKGRAFRPGPDPTRWILVMDKGGTKNERIGLLTALNRGQYGVNDFGDAYVDLADCRTNVKQQVISNINRRSREAGFTYDIKSSEHDDVIKFVFYVFDDSEVLNIPLDSNTDRNWPEVTTMPGQVYEEKSLYYAISRARAALAGKGPAVRLETTARHDDRKQTFLTFHRNRMYGMMSMNWGYAIDLAMRADLDCDTRFRDGLPMDGWLDQNHDFNYGTALKIDFATKNIGVALQHLNEVETRFHTRDRENMNRYASYVQRIKQENEKKAKSAEPVVFRPSVNLTRSLMLD